MVESWIINCPGIFFSAAGFLVRSWHVIAVAIGLTLRSYYGLLNIKVMFSGT